MKMSLMQSDTGEVSRKRGTFLSYIPNKLRGKMI